MYDIEYQRVNFRKWILSIMLVPGAQEALGVITRSKRRWEDNLKSDRANTREASPLVIGIGSEFSGWPSCDTVVRNLILSELWFKDSPLHFTFMIY